MRAPVTPCLLAALTVAMACNSATDDALQALEARVVALEARATDVRPAPGDPAADDTTERLDADLRSLERRLSDLEADVALLTEAAERGDLGAAAAAAARRQQRDARRGRLRDLTAEYRAKLDDLRREYRDDPGNPERQRALRDVVDWYRAERRAIMRDG